MNGIVDHERALDQEPHSFHEQNDTVQHKQFARGRCAARTEQIHKADDDCQDADDEFRHQGSALEEADDSENTENKHHDRKHGHYVKECTDRSGNTEKACDNKQNTKNNTCDNHTNPLSNKIIVPYCQRDKLKRRIHPSSMRVILRSVFKNGIKKVGNTGFEPMTSSSRTKRATKLR